MRVLHVHSGNLFGGIERILVAIASTGRSDASVDHSYALCFDGRLSRELTAIGARMHRLPEVRVSRPRTVVSARRALTNLLGSAGFDRVVFHGTWALAVWGPTVRRARVPIVFWVHDAVSGNHWTERLARRTTPDLIICNSHFTAGTLPALYPGAPATVLYAPVAMTTGPISADGRSRLRAEYETPPAATVIVQASRSEAWKGHEVLVDALSRLRDVEGWMWWLIGGAQRPPEAAFMAAVRDRADRAGIADRIRWLGERNDVPRVMGGADLYCQANIGPEPFGIAFIEALAAGLPVVSSRIGGVCEIIDDRCGVLVPPGEPDALADVLRSLLTDPRRRRAMAVAAPERARSLCDSGTQLAALHRLLVGMDRVEGVA